MSIKASTCFDLKYLAIFREFLIFLVRDSYALTYMRELLYIIKIVVTGILLFFITLLSYYQNYIIIIIIIIIIISFMQGIYTYIPETNYIPREYSVAAILLLLFIVLISLVSLLNLLYFYISTFRSMCAVPKMAVFCSSLTSCFPGMLLTYFLND